MYILGKEEVKEFEKVMKSGRLFRYGEKEAGHLLEVQNFEKELAKKIGVRYALCLTSGTASLISGLVGMKVGPGDEVIVPGYTFLATAVAVLAVGAIPIIAEVDESITMDPADFEKKITKRTKAVIPVHMRGLPCDMDEIKRIAKKNKILIMEDACQADGGSYKGKRLASIGDAGAFSFNYFKIITAGEGGALVTSNRNIFERALIYHDCGSAFWGPCKKIKTPFFAGYNYRANEFMGAILRIQLKRLDPMLKAMREQKNLYISELEGHPAFEFIKANDIQGDCGVTNGFLFDNAGGAMKFSKILKDKKIGNFIPFYSNRHVYWDWEVVMKKRGAHNPALDAYKLPQNRGSKVNYSVNMCPKTRDILARTVFVDNHPSFSRKEVEQRIKICGQAALDV